MAIGHRLINARSETVAEKPSFRGAFARRRCLIPADGFYEWSRRGDRKRPYYFHMRDGEPFAIAGLWERREGEGGPLETCTLLTTGANELLSFVSRFRRSVEVKKWERGEDSRRAPLGLPAERFGAV